MRHINTILILLGLALFTSCNSAKSNVNGESEPMATSEENLKMVEAGFMKGTVIHSTKEGDCPYVIDVDDANYDYMLDPINLDENYKADGAKIWFKFAGLRMPNRCEKANPVNITEIQTRE